MAEANPEPVMFAETSSTTDQYPLANVIMESDEIITKEAAIAIEVKAEDEEKDVDNYTPKLEASQPDVDMSHLNPGERVRCNECHRYTAESMEQLLRHVRKVHRGQNPFQCYMCDYSTYNKSLFEEHVRIHKGIKPFNCNFCPYKSASKKNAKKHELIHRPNNPLRCPSCPFIARHVRSLNCHRREHAKGKTPDEIERLVHEQEVAREKFKHKCDNCGADFAVARNLASHQRATKKCEECDLVLCSKILYKKHMACEHSKEVEEEVSFHCALCPWKSSTKTRILLHLIHHPKQEVDDDIDVGILRKYGIME